MLTKTTTRVIGISGCTNGGKTTLSKKLLLNFPNSFYLSQDDFYFERPDFNNNVAGGEAETTAASHYKYIPELDSYNFDVIDCIDMDRFHKELNKLIKLAKYDYIFLDGILLYEDKRLCAMLHKRYFLDLDMETCKERRKNRNYIIPDTGNYFEKCCWQEFQNYKRRCQSNYSNLVYIDATDLPDNIFNFVRNDILLSSSAATVGNCSAANGANATPPANATPTTAH